MPQVEFEPPVPAFERAKTVHALDRTAAVVGNQHFDDGNEPLRKPRLVWKGNIKRIFKE
jgi:hypothetical protein